MRKTQHYLADMDVCSTCDVKDHHNVLELKHYGNITFEVMPLLQHCQMHHHMNTVLLQYPPV